MTLSGSYTGNGYFYKPGLGAEGATEKAAFDTALDGADAEIGTQATKLGLFPTLGDAGYTTLAAAVTTIGSDNTTLTVPAGSWVAGGVTVPANVTLQIQQGGYFTVATGKTLTINGPIEAGPYQIISWTGTGAIDISASPTTDIPLEWFGAVTGTSADCSAALSMALDACGPHQTIWLGDGIWRIASSVTKAGATHCYMPSIRGRGMDASVLYVDVGASNDGLTLGSNSYAVYGMWLRDFTVAGPASACKNALKLTNWNGNGGTKDINLIIGSTDYAVYLSRVENCNWDFGLGLYNGRMGDLGLTCGVAANGIKAAADGGGAGTYNKLRIMKTASYAGSRAFLGDTIWDWEIEQSDIENCMSGEVDYWSGGYAGTTASLYTGAVTKIAQTFTLAGSTTITNIVAMLSAHGTPHGNVTATLYATTGGAPTGAALATSVTAIPAARLNPSDTNTWNTLFKLPGTGVTLAAGTYALAIEFSSGDASNYVIVDVDTAGTHAGTCYTYSGAAWHAQTYDLNFALNAAPAVSLVNSYDCKVKHIHFETNRWDLQIDNCHNTQLENVSAGSYAEITRSKQVRVDGASQFGFLYIDPVSTVTLGDILLTVPGILEDNGGSLYVGNVQDWISYKASANTRGNSLANYCPNYLMNRWQADHPDSWNLGSNLTWTVENTYVHRAANSAKIVLSAADTAAMPFTADMLRAVKGQHMIASTWLMFPAGQSWAGQHYLSIDLTVAAWVNGTAYKVGDGVYEDGSLFIAVIPGTSGTAPNEPTWSGVADAGYVADNGILWLRWGGVQLSGSTIDTSASNGIWNRYAASCYVPGNCTAVAFNVNLVDQISGHTTVYMAEPSLNIGPIPSRGLPAANETAKFLEVNGSRIVADAYPPDNASSEYNSGYYFAKGDMCLNKAAASSSAPGGWSCTTAGSPGTWKAWANLP